MYKGHSISINGRRIAEDEPPFLIAELSANHNGRLETALEIVSAAKVGGADAVKLQTYRPDTITLNSSTEDFQIHGGLWDGRTLHDLYQQAHLPWEWHAPLFEHARKIGITIFSSPFDATAVDLLENLNAPAYKIASFEVVDLPLIKYVASTRKPVIISTGMADVEEIAEAIAAARSAGSKEIAVLRCVSGYPAPASEYNLHTIRDMIERFGLVAGLSDHTLGNATAIASIALGASIIEKHFTLDRNGGGPDDAFSMEPADLSALCRDARISWESLGRVDYGAKFSERANVKFRRSLYFVRSLKAGDVVTSDAIRSVRPGYGLPPKFAEAIVGKSLKVDITFATPVTWDVLE